MENAMNISNYLKVHEIYEGKKFAATLCDFAHKPWDLVILRRKKMQISGNFIIFVREWFENVGHFDAPTICEEKNGNPAILPWWKLGKAIKSAFLLWLLGFHKIVNIPKLS